MTTHAAVIRLPRLFYPADIAGLIVAVVIDALYGVLSAWPRSNVFKELREVVAPLLAHEDASPSVPRIERRLGIGASRLDVRPRSIFGAPSESVRRSDFSNGLSLQASARTSASTVQPYAAHYGAPTAITPARDGSCSLSADMCRFSRHGKPTKSRTDGNVQWLRHIGIISEIVEAETKYDIVQDQLRDIQKDVKELLKR